jgi:hypothetical protein
VGELHPEELVGEEERKGQGDAQEFEDPQNGRGQRLVDHYAYALQYCLKEHNLKSLSLSGGLLTSELSWRKVALRRSV